jgi:hypothetical protein
MKCIGLAIVCLGVANALPMVQPAVSNGVLLETAARTPTFAKGIRTDCNYETISHRDLGGVFAQGDETKYTPKDLSVPADVEDALKQAKVACDDMGPDCGGVVQDPLGCFALYRGSSLKVCEGCKTHLKEICAFPLPYSNFWKGENAHDDLSKTYNDDHEDAKKDAAHGTPDDTQGDGAPKRDMGNGKVYKFNHATNPNVEKMRWKLSNGPSYSRIDDGKDHGSKSRIMDGKSEQDSVDACMKICATRTDCMSGP